jgi:HD-like signal output (HDOD) protein
MYIAGLFHDIGKLFLVTHFPDLYEDLLAANSRDDRRLCEQERCVFGIDHEKVGSMILRTWCFPKAVQMACFQSQDRSDRSDALSPVSRVVAVSDALSHLLVDGEIDWCPEEDSLSKLSSRLSALRVPIQAVLDRATARIAHVASVLDIALTVKPRRVSELLDMSGTKLERSQRRP